MKRRKQQSRKKQKPKSPKPGKSWQSSVLRRAVSKALSTPPEDERNAVVDALSGSSTVARDKN